MSSAAKSFFNAVKDRRTFYAINKSVKVPDDRIREIVDFSVKWTPSAFNTQSARVITLLGGHHDKFWDITKEILRKIVPADKFAPTEGKMKSFRDGYGTILFFEDQATVKKNQAAFPLYAQHFSTWSDQASGMVQYNVWTGLETEGLGCSLQHYNPLVDDAVRKEWKAPEEWKLMSQLVLGNPYQQPGEKSFLPIEDRVKHFK